jgi:hypothetical protein
LNNINKIVDLVNEGNFVVIERKLSISAEIELIKTSMNELEGENFMGIDISEYKNHSSSKCFSKETYVTVIKSVNQ